MHRGLHRSLPKKTPWAWMAALRISVDLVGSPRGHRGPRRFLFFLLLPPRKKYNGRVGFFSLHVARPGYIFLKKKGVSHFFFYKMGRIVVKSSAWGALGSISTSPSRFDSRK